MTKMQLQELAMAATYTRESLEELMTDMARIGKTEILVETSRIPDSLELDLNLDGFDIEPLATASYIRISWK